MKMQHSPVVTKDSEEVSKLKTSSRRITRKVTFEGKKDQMYVEQEFESLLIFVSAIIYSKPNVFISIETYLFSLFETIMF
jgi:hypothetical protein